MSIFLSNLLSNFLSSSFLLCKFAMLSQISGTNFRDWNLRSVEWALKYRSGVFCSCQKVQSCQTFSWFKVQHGSQKSESKAIPLWVAITIIYTWYFRSSRSKPEVCLDWSCQVYQDIASFCLDFSILVVYYQSEIWMEANNFARYSGICTNVTRKHKNNDCIFRIMHRDLYILKLECCFKSVTYWVWKWVIYSKYLWYICFYF